MTRYIRNYSVLLACLAIAAVAVLWLQPLYEPQSRDSTSKKAPEIQPVAKNEAAAIEILKAPGNQKSEQNPKKSLAAQMNEASDLRVFAQLAHNSPLAGGLYYEQLAVGFCRNTQESNFPLTLPSSSITDHKDATQRDRALNKLNQLCRSFIPEELNASRFIDEAYRRFADESKDPAIRIRDGLLKAYMSSDSIAMRQLTREAIELKDLYILSKSPIGQASGSAVFQGKKYTEEDLTLYVHALGLASCDLNGGCEQPDLEVVWVCASQGFCENSQEALRIRLLREGGASDAKISQMMELRRLMVNAILLGDVDSFFPAK